MAGRGGAREGAGRKTKAEILGLAKTLEQCVTAQEEALIWAAIKKEALKGSIQHSQLYLSYKYGKPSEHIISENDNETTIRIIRAGNPSVSQQSSSSSVEDNLGSKEV